MARPTAAARAAAVALVALAALLPGTAGCECPAPSHPPDCTKATQTQAPFFIEHSYASVMGAKGARGVGP